MSRKWWIIIGILSTINGILLAILGFGNILYDETFESFFIAVFSVFAFIVAIGSFVCAAEKNPSE
ncbi:MAG: hypothetical protein ACI4K6_06280 [Candidatus Fimenecus sp.]